MNAVLKRLETLSRSLSGPLPLGSTHDQAIRVAEAVLFASAEPISIADLASRLPADSDAAAIVGELARAYSGRGVNLVAVAGGWAFRTADDLAHAVASGPPLVQKPSPAAMEVLAIVAYHQPTTRAEIEEIRGVSASKGTLDTLIKAGWIRLRGRRRAPGRPVTYGTTPAFLDQFGLEAITDLPGLDELKGLGFLEGRVPSAPAMPIPSDSLALGPDEDPLESNLLSITPDET